MGAVVSAFSTCYSFIDKFKNAFVSSFFRVQVSILDFTNLDTLGSFLKMLQPQFALFLPRLQRMGQMMQVLRRL